MKFMNAPDVCQNFISTLFDDRLLTFGHLGRYCLVEWSPIFNFIE